MEELIRQIISWGPPGVVAGLAVLMWREERKERIEAQKALSEIGRRSIEADFTVAKSMDDLSSSLNSVVRTLTDIGR